MIRKYHFHKLQTNPCCISYDRLCWSIIRVWRRPGLDRPHFRKMYNFSPFTKWVSATKYAGEQFCTRGSPHLSRRKMPNQPLTDYFQIDIFQLPADLRICPSTIPQIYFTYEGRCQQYISQTFNHFISCHLQLG